MCVPNQATRGLHSTTCVVASEACATASQCLRRPTSHPSTARFVFAVVPNLLWDEMNRSQGDVGDVMWCTVCRHGTGSLAMLGCVGDDISLLVRVHGPPLPLAEYRTGRLTVEQDRVGPRQGGSQVVTFT